MFKLVQQDKAAVRIELSHDRGSDDKLFSTAYTVPFMPVIQQLSVLNGKSFKGQVGTAQQVSFSLPYVLYLLSEICIL